MSEHIHQTIADLQRKLRQQEEQVSHTKQLINLLCSEAGIEAMYAEVDSTTDSIESIRSDLFYGRPLATVIKEYLKMRRAANRGAATVAEIYKALVHGGYAFRTKIADPPRRPSRNSWPRIRPFIGFRLDHGA